MTQELKPYPFQRKDIDKVWNKFGGRALKAWEMGLGKSPATLWGWRWNCDHPGPLVIVCPAYLKLNWEREVQTFLKMRAVVLDGETPPLYPPRGKVYIINYDILSPKRRKRGRGGPVRPWWKVLRQLRPSCVVVDESQYLKEMRTKRTKDVRKLQRGVPHFLALSGTGCIENCPAELFPVLNMIRPKRFATFYPFGVRYCLAPDAPVLMGDFTEKPIREVKMGDYVMGWSSEGKKQRRLVRAKVLDIVVKKAPLQRVVLETGKELICTPDHKWATGSSQVPYRIAVAHREGVVGRGGGSTVMEVFRGIQPQFLTTHPDYRAGYIQGAFRGDGHCVLMSKTHHHPFKSFTKEYAPKHRTGIACKDKPVLKRLSKYLKSMGVDCPYFRRRDGLWTLRNCNNIRMYRLLTETTTEKNTDEWWAGFLAGIYDTDGSYRTICQCQEVNPDTYRMIATGLNRFKFDYDSRPDSIIILGGRQEMIRFWSVASPSLFRKLDKYIMSKGGKLGTGGGVASGRRGIRVMKIHPLPGIHTTYTLTTETGNYIAYGHGSKNCQPRKTPWGMEYKGATNTKELNRLLKSVCMVRRQAADVLKDLPKLRSDLVTVGLTNRKEYDKAEKDLIGWLLKWNPKKAKKAANAERLVRWAYLRKCIADGKYAAVVEWVTDFLATGKKLLLFGFHTEFLVKIQKAFKNSILVTGKTPPKQRDHLFHRFNSDPAVRLMVGNIDAAGTGWSCRATSTVAFCELVWNPAKHRQAAKRVHGINRGVKGEPARTVYLIAHGTVEEQMAAGLQRKQGIQDQVLDGKKAGGDMDLRTMLEQKLLRKVGR